MAKKNTANGESQTEDAQFPPEPVVLPPDPTVAAATDQPQQQQFTLVDEQPVPKALSVLINNSNKTLQETQQRLMGDINESANDLMGLLQISREEGWLLDVEGQRFVRVEPVQE
jgi:hypothetical protein